MVSNMRKMKDSGVEWIGEIPNNWSIAKLGDYFTEKKERVSDIDFKPLSVTKYGIVPQLKNVAKTKNNDDRKRVEKGNFVINSRSDRKQSCGLSTLDGSVSVINTVLIPRIIQQGFVKYLLDNYGFAEEFFRWGSGIHFDLWSTKFTKMKTILLPIPTGKDEQQRIANYLDQKVSQIDNIIQKTKESIEEYKKYKQSLITEIVTKGLNPNVKMKDSGIEWIGEIPEHWGLTKIINFVRLNNGKDNIVKEGKIPVYGSGGIFGYTNECLYDGETVLFGRKGTIDKPQYVQGKLWAVDTAFYSIAKGSVNMKFFYYLAKIIEFDLYKSGSVLPSMTQTTLNEIKMPYPIYEEQKQIASYLDKKMQDIQYLITQKKAVVLELETYKKSLIYEVVTGKKEI